MIKFPRMNMKNINRFVLIALLCAPIVYLFGSLFTALNGAHGVQLFSQEEEDTSVDMSVTYEGASYQRYYYNPSSVWVDIYGMSEITGDDVFYYYGDSVNISLDTSVSYFETNLASYSQDECFGMFDGDANFYSEVGGLQYLSFYLNNNGKPYSVECLMDEGSFFGHIVYYSSVSNSVIENNYLDVNNFWNAFGFAPSYFEFGADLSHSSFNASDVDLLDSMRIAPRVAPTITTPSVSEEISYSDYVFGQFFAKDNFLSQIGVDALIDPDQGFYPANALLRVLDENVLHYGSENNTACMAYGYFVWVFNVVLLDMVVYLSMKLLLLPLKAVDVFERGNDL